MLIQRHLNSSTRIAALAVACALIAGCAASNGNAPGTSVPATAGLATIGPTLAPAPTAAARPTQSPAATTASAAVASQAVAAAQSASQSTTPAQGQSQSTTPTQGQSQSTNSAQSPSRSTAEAQSPASGSATDVVRLVVDSSASNASYHAHEQLAGHTLPSEAVGTSPGVSGSLVLSADGSILVDQSTITVDLSQLKSDESRRDNWIKGNTLQTDRYPKATFVAREVQGLPAPLPTSGQTTFQLLGDLTVHGVTKPATWQVTAQFGATTVNGTATTSVNISDFGMTPPKVGPVLNIEDGLTLELAFTASREA